MFARFQKHHPGTLEHLVQTVIVHQRHLPAESQFRFLHHAVSFQDDSLSGLNGLALEIHFHIYRPGIIAQNQAAIGGVCRADHPLEMKRINGALPALTQAI